MLVAHRSMVDLPCPDIAVHKPVAKRTLVHKTFLCDNTVLNRKLVPTDASMVDFSCLGIAVHQLVAKWTLVRNTFLCNNAVLHLEPVPACPAMIHLACASLTERKQDRHIGNAVPLRCFASICQQAGLAAGLGAVLLLGCLQSCILVFGLPHFVFALFFFRLSFLFSSPFLFCDVNLGMGTGHCCPVFSPLLCARLCSLRLREILCSFPFSFRNGSLYISYDTRLFFFHGRRS